MQNHTNDPTAPNIASALRHARLVDAVLSRYQARRGLRSMANEIYSGLASASSSSVTADYVGETEKGTICGKGANGLPVLFQCSKNGADKFNCTAPGGFTCGATYSDCDKAAGSTFECKKDFDCKNDFFDCSVFSCGDPTGAAGSYNCDEKKDFVCGGADFDCHDDFDCTAGHVFFCADNHECKDNFECKATGNPECDGTPGNKYGVPENDGNAGDFICGHPGPDGDQFDCTATFDCNSKDDFDCIKSTTFNCGDGNGTDQFNCAKDTHFQCDTKFDCKGGAGKFECKGKAGGNFTCDTGKGSYTAP
jgi:hypothetical protein